MHKQLYLPTLADSVVAEAAVVVVAADAVGAEAAVRAVVRPMDTSRIRKPIPWARPWPI